MQPNVLQLVATDFAGNIGRASVAVFLDASIPEVTITAPTEGEIFDASPIRVEGTLSEEELTVVLGDDVAAVVTGTSFVVEEHELVEGLNTLSVRATDRAGNTGDAEVTVRLDTQPPDVTINSPAQGSRLSQSPVSCPCGA